MIVGPLTPVNRGYSRSLADTPPRRSGRIRAEIDQLPKLIARVRFPSPAPITKTKVASGFRSLGLVRFSASESVPGWSGIGAHVLDTNDLLALVRRHCVPDGHVVRWQVQLVGARQRVISGEWVGEGRDWFV
jgi:hypothetical protein